MISRKYHLFSRGMQKFNCIKMKIVDFPSKICLYIFLEYIWKFQNYVAFSWKGWTFWKKYFFCSPQKSPSFQIVLIFFARLTVFKNQRLSCIILRHDLNIVWIFLNMLMMILIYTTNNEKKIIHILMFYFFFQNWD